MRAPLSVLIVVALLAGLVVGPLVGTAGADLGEVGKIVIQLIKAAATPLVFLAIVHAIVTTDVAGRDGARMVGFATFNACVALSIGLVLSNLLRPGTGLKAFTTPKDVEPPTTDRVDFVGTFTSHLPQDIVTPFADNAVLSVVLLALLVGFGLRRTRREQIEKGETRFQVVEDAIVTLLRANEAILGWVVLLVPFAVFAVVVMTVGKYGYAPFRGLAVYVGVGLLGLTLHVAVTYQAWLLLRWRGPLAVFWREAREPVIYAAGANSSLATLPLTLAALDRLGVRRSSSALGACVGTNFNNDGILLYEGMAVLFVAQAAGIDLTLSQQVIVALSALVAAMGVAGVPEAGVVSMTLVLNTVDLPTEIVPLLLTVDWVVARARSVVNVLSDMVLSILVDGPAPAAARPGV